MEKYPTDSFQYLEVEIDSKWNWKSNVRLDQAEAMLLRLRNVFTGNIHKSIYCTLAE